MKRPTRAIPKAVRKALPTICEVEGCGKKAQAAHHIVPARLADQNKKLGPHDPRNLLSVCISHNNAAVKGEKMLAAGNGLGFLQHMNKLHFPMERVRAALELYGWG